jgi:cytochrome c oxidase subunit 2
MRRLWLGTAAAFLALFAAAPAVPQDTTVPRVVEVTAKRFEFTPKELTLKKGETVTFRFRSEDVTHGFLLRTLKLDVDITPGKATDVTVTPQKAGTFTAICDHFCGAGHGGMKMKVVVVEE